MYERKLKSTRQNNFESTASNSVEVSPSRNVSASAPDINFADEVIDISNISIFGDVNDGSTNCTAEAESGDSTLPQPAPDSESVAGSPQGGVTFGDEVVDISGISVFGDVNDVGCD